ncbi:WD40 repeat-like protein [Daedaleopsis nitida]|nr:WD40 repeat-like protein [Daedaleopsis nitida]
MAADAGQPIILPICTIQHDFQAVVKDVHGGLVPNDHFWISCYKDGEPSIHGKAVASLDERNRDLVLYEGHGGVGLKDYGKNAYAVSCPSLDIPETRLAVPMTSYPALPDTRKSAQITAFDIAPDGSQYVTGYHDGSVHIRPTSSPNASPSASTKSHLSTVTSLQFFPSSRVVLTAGADFSISILPADVPESSSYSTAKMTAARTFRGHTRAVTSTGIIARGRNILSGSKDGTLRLWDVPSGQQIRTFAAGTNQFVPVLALNTSTRWTSADADAPAESDTHADPREVETADKVVFCALQDGSFELFDLRTKHAEFRSLVSPAGARSALQAVAYSSGDNLVGTGSAAGLTTLYDTRTLGSDPIVTFRRNTAPIEDLKFIDLSAAPFSLGASHSASSPRPGDVGLAIATEDGLPYVAEVRPSGPRLRAELVGTDCDGVRHVRVVGGHIWTASDDGVVRRYAP